MSKATLAIYGSKDLDSRNYPVFTHNHNLCLMKDGVILQYLELERYTRKKYDNRLDLFIEELLSNKIFELPDEFDFVLANDFLSSFFLSKNGAFRFECASPYKLSNKLIPGTLTLLSNKNSIKKIPAFCCSHELAHIFSAIPFYGHFKDNSLLLSIDGASSLGNYSSFIFKNGHLNLIENNWNDLGFVSKLFNDNPLVFKILGASKKDHCSIPGKLMGFASFGNPRRDIETWLKKNDYFNDFWGKEYRILDSIAQHFGINPGFETTDQFMQDVAATFQKIFENAVLGKLKKLQDKLHCDYLYYGGGCALNIVTNTKIIESRLFKDVFIAPCCNDSGLSIGAACFAEMEKGNFIQIHNGYLSNVSCNLQDSFDISDAEIELVSQEIKKGKIIGICNGSAEIGPRALGNRSLIALPNNKALAQHLSMNVKKREWYRPVAPIMLLELAKKIAIQKPKNLSKFMLMDFHIKEEFQKDLAGVIHINGTSRIQTIASEKDNPFMYKLLKRLEKDGILALINTSFNIQGKPIVHTKEDALLAFKTMPLDGLVLNGKFISKK